MSCKSRLPVFVQNEFHLLFQKKKKEKKKLAAKQFRYLSKECEERASQCSTYRPTVQLHVETVFKLTGVKKKSLFSDPCEQEKQNER